MKLVVEKIQDSLNHYFLRIEDTDTDEFYLVDVDYYVWLDYNEGDVFKFDEK
jgi:hypothetical protein